MLLMSSFLYIEARLFPEPALRWYKVRPTWVCLGVGLASITIGIRHNTI